MENDDFCVFYLRPKFRKFYKLLRFFTQIFTISKKKTKFRKKLQKFRKIRPLLPNLMRKRRRSIPHGKSLSYISRSLGGTLSHAYIFSVKLLRMVKLKFDSKCNKSYPIFVRIILKANYPVHEMGIKMNRNTSYANNKCVNTLIK